VASAVKNRVADTGFLVALWRGDDQDHAWAVATARAHPPPWITCEAVLAEADHLLGRLGRASLRTACRRGAVRIVSVLPDDVESVIDLLDRYDDVPMSIADGCLVRMTEVLAGALVLTTDTDFKVYRRHSRKVVPVLLPQRG
jgi:predicted nucleic acid-binding protein